MKKIQVLGTGCLKCKLLAKTAEQAAKNAGVDCEIIKVTDISEITSFGVMMTPALVIDGEIKVVGKVPSVEELQDLIK